MCRCLFGRPDPDSFEEETLQKLQHLDDEAAQRWNFDFRAGRPLTDPDGKGRYEWTRVDNCDSVPSVYNSMLSSTQQVESHMTAEMSVNVTESENNALITDDTLTSAISASSSAETNAPTAVTAAAAESESNPPTSCESPDGGLNRNVE